MLEDSNKANRDSGLGEDTTSMDCEILSKHFFPVVFLPMPMLLFILRPIVAVMRHQQVRETIHKLAGLAMGMPRLRKCLLLASHSELISR